MSIIIYVFSDEYGVPKYVGKIKNLERRIKEHTTQGRFKYKTPFYSWLNKVINEGKAYYVDTLEECTEENWEEREKYWIKHIKDNNFELKNLTEGGYIKHLPKVTLICPECRKKRQKPVLQYDLEGNFIREWESVTEAAHNVGTSTSCISRCCKEKDKYTKRFQWRYKLKENIDNKIEICKSKLKRVLQYNRNMELIKEWDSATDLTKELGLNRNKIYEVLESKKGIVGEFILREKIVIDNVNKYYE